MNSLFSNKRVINKIFSYNLKKFFSSNLVKIKYSDLINTNNKENYLFDSISQAYNQEGLGIMVIEKVPQMLEIKQKLFQLSHQLVNLPEEALRKIERPDKTYAVGWSYGKEYLGDKPDLLKASFYAALEPLNKQMPTEDNSWPAEIPELQATFNALGNVIRQVGLIILKNIDLFIKQKYPSYNLNYPEIVSNSNQNFGRLLYYHARKKISLENLAENSDNWCEWHNDHGSLTGLVSASYLNEDGTVAKNLNLTKTGLYVQNRKGEVLRMSYGEDDIAFQLGETLQIHSGGLLNATPHAVKFMDDVPDNIARTTLALFMEPNQDFKLNIPKESCISNVNTSEMYKFIIPEIEKRFTENMTFGLFTEKTYELYYNLKKK